MNRKEYFEHQNKIHKECLEISRRKSADYAGTKDPFRNFRIAEQVGICTVEVGILIRLSDKFSRLCTLISKNQEGEVKDETIFDTLNDLINYSIILSSYLYDKKKDKQ